jgi:hypothetical protein
MELSKLPPSSPDHGRRGATPKRPLKPARRPSPVADEPREATPLVEEPPARRIDVTA